MAGRGPAPKDPAERRNRTPPSRGEWVDLPPLPKRAKGEGPWSARTRRLYNGWRKDPVTQTYGEAEISAAVELAYLQEELVRGKVTMASEVRQRMDGLGLTPKGKRDLRFRVVEETQAEEQVRRPRARSPRSDRRARLTLVKS